MNKILSVCLVSLLLFSCKDEFNIPVSESYVDGDVPVIVVNSPTSNKTYTGTTSVPIEIQVDDNFALKNVKIEIRDYSSGEAYMSFEQEISDSTFTYISTFNFPTIDSTAYELVVTASDAVENVDYAVVPFTSK